MLNDVADFHCSASSVSVESYLENGRKLLAAGQLADALTQYHAAVGQLQIYASMFYELVCKRKVTSCSTVWSVLSSLCVLWLGGFAAKAFDLW